MPQLTLLLPPKFKLAHAVCSYGYFILAPNRWIDGPRRGQGRLIRPLRDAAGRSVDTVIRQRGRQLLITSNRAINKADRAQLHAQVRRMLRLDEDLSPWRELHPEADSASFDRLFRSPTLFEDIVKTMTGCNVSWPNTVRMNQLLCEHIGAGDFPTPAELAARSAADTKRLCKVGYRAERIVRLARDVHDGRLDMAWFEQGGRSTDELYDKLLEIYGVGDYAANNVLQCLGRYDRLPVDSETLRHFRHLHNVKGDLRRVTAAAKKHYRRYAPYQFLAYWFELWQDYQLRHGPARAWSKEVYVSFTASKLNQPAAAP